MTEIENGFHRCHSVMFGGTRCARVLGALVLVLSAMSGFATDPTWAFGQKNKGGFGGGLGGGTGGGFGKGGNFGAGGQKGGDPVAFYFPEYDSNGDGELDRSEWKRRGNFERLDTNGSGTIDRSEFRAIYDTLGQKWRLGNPIRPSDTAEMDASVDRDRVSAESVGKRTVCGITRTGGRDSNNCRRGDETDIQLGLFETGIGPVFPKGAMCKGIDEIFAMDYTKMTGIGRHGGIDIPTDFHTPILAVAAGSVVGKFDQEANPRGRILVLRHDPADTGLPFWVFTEYAHLDSMPAQKIGQRVRMGEVLGPTGNSGMSKKNSSGVSLRRPAIHFAVYYGDSPRFAEVESYIVPENGRWMDPNALFRTSPPYDTSSVKALPEAEKGIPIPVIYLNGHTEPANTKLIWPYACKRG